MELDITKFVVVGDSVYSPVCGPAYVKSIITSYGVTKINIATLTGLQFSFTADGKLGIGGECLLFPSKDNRDWDSVNKETKVRYVYQFNTNEPETVYWYRVTNNKRWNEALHDKLVELTGKKNLAYPIPSEGMIFFSEKEGLSCSQKENKIARMAMMVGKEITIESEISYV